MATTPTASDLRTMKCKACEGGTSALHATQVAQMLKQLPGWGLEDGQIEKVYQFKNYYETLAFVNALAWISHREDHHPDLEVGYNKCKVAYSTHAVNGLTENDFICAAKVEALLG